MALILKISFLITFCSALWFMSSAQTEIQIDTSKIAIIQAEYGQKIIYLTNEDLKIIDSIILSGVNIFNKSTNKADQLRRINLSMDQYKKQLLVSRNGNNEIEITVHCFCRTYDDRWKTEPYFVKDGGSCYFRLKINLKTKIYFNFLVNGSA